MIIDPSARRRHDPFVTNRLEAAEVMALGLELASIVQDLRTWDVIGGFGERMVSALQGRDGISLNEITRMRRWSARWKEISPEVRAFWREHADQPWAPPALRRMLEGTQVEGHVVGRARRAWADRYGSEPGHEIIPAARPHRSLP